VNHEDFDALARVVDERVLALPVDDVPARVFGIRLRGDEIVLVPFWAGVAREMPAMTPPDDCIAIAIDCSGWAAPMEDDGSVRGRPSQHPERRRVHHTALVYGDGADVSVLRYEGESPLLLRDGVGLVLDLLRACWAQRRHFRSCDGM
jgi:hypothetical protein